MPTGALGVGEVVLLIDVDKRHPGSPVGQDLDTDLRKDGTPEGLGSPFPGGSRSPGSPDTGWGWTIRQDDQLLHFHGLIQGSGAYQGQVIDKLELLQLSRVLGDSTKVVCLQVGHSGPGLLWCRGVLFHGLLLGQEFVGLLRSGAVLLYNPGSNSHIQG